MGEYADLAQRVTDLEVSLAHQQRLCEQLNEVVTRQTRQLLQFEKSMPQLANQLRELKSAVQDLSPQPKNEKPPHY